MNMWTGHATRILMTTKNCENSGIKEIVVAPQKRTHSSSVGHVNSSLYGREKVPVSLVLICLMLSNVYHTIYTKDNAQISQFVVYFNHVSQDWFTGIATIISTVPVKRPCRIWVIGWCRLTGASDVTTENEHKTLIILWYVWQTQYFIPTIYLQYIVSLPYQSYFCPRVSFNDSQRMRRYHSRQHIFVQGLIFCVKSYQQL